MPFYRRVKVLRFWDGELPRTSTRKVKRKLVVEELQKLERLAASGEKARRRRRTGGSTDWLLPASSPRSSASRPATVGPGSRLAADLGFDSLMLTELSVALEAAGIALPAVEDLSQVQTVEDLRALLGSAGRRPRRSRPRACIPRRPRRPPEDREIPVPAPVASLGRTLLDLGQKVLFGGVFDVKVTGKAFVPQSRNFLVIANHSSATSTWGW